MKSEQGYNYNLLNIDITNGVSDLEFEYQGEKIVYLHGNADISIKLWSNSNDEIPLSTKHAIIAPFKRFYVTAPASDETIQLLIASPANFTIDIKQVNVDNVNEVITIGNLENIDNVAQISLINKTINDYYRSYIEKNCFIGCGWRTANSGYYPYVSLINPSGSNINVVVNKIYTQFWSSGDGTIIRLTFNYQNSRSLNSHQTNKYWGENSPQAYISSFQETLSVIGYDIHVFRSVAYRVHEINFYDKLILPPGSEILVSATSSGSSVRANFEWIEVEQ